MTTISTARAVEPSSTQVPERQPVSHRVRNLLLAGALAVAAAIALLIWALLPASSPSSPAKPTAPGQVQRIGLGDVQGPGDSCLVPPGTNFC